MWQKFCKLSIVRKGLSKHTNTSQPRDKDVTVQKAQTGPQSLTNNVDLKQELQQYSQNVEQIKYFVNYEKCHGSYLVDADGNTLLDMASSCHSTCLGFNNAALLKKFQANGNLKYLLNRPTSEHYPADILPELIQKFTCQISPNLPILTLLKTGNCPNEAAIRSMIISNQFERNNNDYIEDILYNSRTSILSFKAREGLYPERYESFNSLMLDWPVASFPKYRYPLEDNEQYNLAEDEKCLAMVQELVELWRKKGKPVVGVIVQPIHGNSNLEASIYFFQKLQAIASENGLYLCMDETKTGFGHTGRFWGHEHFDLQQPPDALTFSNKTNVPGLFHIEELQTSGLEHCGGNEDTSKLLALDATIDCIDEEELIETVKSTGDYLKEGLQDIESEYYSLIHSTRGKGTFLTFSCQCQSLRNDIFNRLLLKGVLCSPCGEDSIFIKPTLTFNKADAAVFLDKFRDVIKETEVVVPKLKKLVFLKETPLQNKLYVEYTKQGTDLEKHQRDERAMEMAQVEQTEENTGHERFPIHATEAEEGYLMKKKQKHNKYLPRLDDPDPCCPDCHDRCRVEKPPKKPRDDGYVEKVLEEPCHKHPKKKASGNVVEMITLSGGVLQDRRLDLDVGNQIPLECDKKKDPCDKRDKCDHVDPLENYLKKPKKHKSNWRSKKSPKVVEDPCDPPGQCTSGVENVQGDMYQLEAGKDSSPILNSSLKEIEYLFDEKKNEDICEKIKPKKKPCPPKPKEKQQRKEPCHEKYKKAADQDSTNSDLSCQVKGENAIMEFGTTGVEPMLTSSVTEHCSSGELQHIEVTFCMVQDNINSAEEWNNSTIGEDVKSYLNVDNLENHIPDLLNKVSEKKAIVSVSEIYIPQNRGLQSETISDVDVHRMFKKSKRGLKEEDFINFMPFKAKDDALVLAKKEAPCPQSGDPFKRNRNPSKKNSISYERELTIPSLPQEPLIRKKDPFQRKEDMVPNCPSCSAQESNEPLELKGGCGDKKDPCKKEPPKKKEDPCKKKDPCKKEPPKKKEDPCKKKDPCKKEPPKKKEDPCKKKDPCKKEPPKKKEDPCKKKDPCKKEPPKKEDPCKKKEDPCKKKEDPCKKKEDPCKKKEDPCKKKEDPCKKKEDPCKKKEKVDPCKKEPPKKKEDPCKKKDPCKKEPPKKKEDPCKKKEDPCKKKEKVDPCKKEKVDPCKKEKVDPCKKEKVDPCKKEKVDPCKKEKVDPCKKEKVDPCKKEKVDPCKKEKVDPCKQEKVDPCKQEKVDPCKKEKVDPCKKKEDPCKKKDPCKKAAPTDQDGCQKPKEPPCKDPCVKKKEKKIENPCSKGKKDPCMAVSETSSSAGVTSDLVSSMNEIESLSQLKVETESKTSNPSQSTPPDKLLSKTSINGSNTSFIYICKPKESVRSIRSYWGDYCKIRG